MSSLFALYLSYWYRIRYALYAPIYVPLANLWTTKQRKVSIDQLLFKEQDKILVVGAGSGIDFKYLPKDVYIVAIDISKVMLSMAKKEVGKKKNIQLTVMDAHQLNYKDGEFDIVILHLILSVVKSPKICLMEATRVLKQNGQMAILDNFHKKDLKSVSWMKKMLYCWLSIFFSDFHLNIQELLISLKLNTHSFIRVNFLGISNFFTIVILRKF